MAIEIRNIILQLQNLLLHFFLLAKWATKYSRRILSKSARGNLLENKSLNISKQKILEGCEYDPLPLLVDELFLPEEYMMRPFLAKGMKMRRFSTTDSREEEES